MLRLNERRSTADLIRELDAEEPYFRLVCLVVGFDNHSEFVFANDEQKLKKLNSLVQSGGEPVGLIGCDWGGGQFWVHTRSLVEFKNEAWVEEFLGRCVDELYEAIVALGTVESGTRLERRTGWVN
ncbi:MAG TPA: hypothetical protein VNO32_66005 [Candidatus Acidoferrum sp.]|jgi:hypothetical protein|nr:hypothetical protein [Candidatus Acidoferrum sp.]